MDKRIIVFCEGDHDIAFLSRILFVDGFTSYEKKVKDFIVPLSDLYIESLKNKKIEDSEFKFQRASINIPYTVLEKENTLVIFHNLGGDGNILNGKANGIVETYLGLNDAILREVGEYDSLTFRFLYFLDADDAGIVNRLSEMTKIVNLTEDLKHYKVVKREKYEVGCCIFYNISDTNTYGKLENILLDLMNSDNEKVFSGSSSFLENNILDESRQRKFICTDKKEEVKGSIEFKKEKSIISIAGQLQFSGANNSVIIANTDYIKKSDILNNLVCKNIITMFQPK